MARALGIGAAAASDLVHRYPGKVDDLCVDEIYAQLEARSPREP